jgi:hypothetical protein
MKTKKRIILLKKVGSGEKGEAYTRGTLGVPDYYKNDNDINNWWWQEETEKEDNRFFHHKTVKSLIDNEDAEYRD